MSNVVAVSKNKEGNLIAFQTDDGRIYSFGEMYDAIGAGQFPDLIATTGKEGAPVIRSQADGKPENNLQNLPPIQDKAGYDQMIQRERERNLVPPTYVTNPGEPIGSTGAPVNVEAAMVGAGQYQNGYVQPNNQGR